jgi:hypothetical protein
LFRRNLHAPEVITFDELVARAEWHVDAAEHEADLHVVGVQEVEAQWASTSDP